MRILVLGINYWPEETGIAVFNTGRCEYLAAQGHQVTMCTGFPYYPQWRVPEEYRRKLFAREGRHGESLAAFRWPDPNYRAHGADRPWTASVAGSPRLPARALADSVSVRIA